MTNEAENRHRVLVEEIKSIRREMQQQMNALKVEYGPPKKPCGGCKTRRKPVSISTQVDDVDDPMLTVICDDGSMWFGSLPLGDKAQIQWTRITEIPQDE